MVFVATNQTLQDAVRAWLRDPAAAEQQYGHISKWDTSSVTDMCWMFYATNFNADISKWDTSSVTNMRCMFCRATNFNADISRWNTSSVTNMCCMFMGAISFNADISKWDTSSVTAMRCMFLKAELLNARWFLHRWPEPKFRDAFGDDAFVEEQRRFQRDCVAFSVFLGGCISRSTEDIPVGCRRIGAMHAMKGTRRGIGEFLLGC